MTLSEAGWPVIRSVSYMKPDSLRMRASEF